LLLATAAVVVEVLIGVPLGMWAAFNRTGKGVVAGVVLVLLSIPSFVIGLLLLLVFGFWIRLFPVIGGGGLRQLALPAIALGLVGVPYYAQIVSEEMTQALASQFARTAVAKGLPNRWILVHHISRNVLSPVITLVGLDLGVFISGVVVIEALFGWPGIGQLAVQSLDDLDRPVILGIALFAAIGVVLFNFAADMVRMIIDPRTRVSA
jgi:peptide/nickel transport system permease protein